MKKFYDAIVIGAGLAGLSVARELARKKQRVLQIEVDRQGGNASRAAAGILDPYTEADKITPQFLLAKEAFAFYPSFLDQLGPRACEKVEFEKTGVLYLASSQRDEAFLRKRFEWQKQHGIAVQFLSGDQARRLEPFLSPRVRAGVYYPEIQKLNAGKLTDLLMKTVKISGVELQMPVRNASLWQEKGKVQGIKTGSNRIESPVVVAARGCWAGSDRRFGVRPDVAPVRGQILILHTKPGRRPRHILHTVRYAYAVPWPGGRVLVGSTLESAGFENRVTPEGKEDILTRAGEIFEDIYEQKIESSWAGLRPFAKRGRPWIGPTQIKGLFLATGYYRVGVLISPVVGKLLSEGILTGKFSPLLKPFYP